MSDWNVNTTKRSDFDATSHVASAMEALGRPFDQGARLITSVDYDVVGMNADQIPEMRNAIRNYVSIVTNKFEAIETSVNRNTAMRNETVQNALKEYLEAVKESLMVLVTQLSAFSDKLADVYNSWVISAEKYADDVVSNRSAEVANATQSRYEETIESAVASSVIAGVATSETIESSNSNIVTETSGVTTAGGSSNTATSSTVNNGTGNRESTEPVVAGTSNSPTPAVPSGNLPTPVERDGMLHYEINGTTFIIPVNMDTSMQVLTVERAVNIFNQLPSEVRSHVNEVTLLDYVNPKDDYWREQYTDFSSSIATGGGGKITFYQNADSTNIHDDKYVRDLYIHEAAHSMDRKFAPEGDTYFSNSSSWANAVESDRGISGLTSPTEYGNNSPLEDFAESLAAYYRDPNGFKQEFPNRFAAIESILK